MASYEQLAADLFDETKSSYRRINAIEELCELEDPRALDAILRSSDDKISNVRRKVAAVLASFNDPKCIQALQKLLNDENEQVRESAVRSLGEIDHLTTELIISRALKDSTWLVRQAAREAIGKVRGRAKQGRNGNAGWQDQSEDNGNDVETGTEPSKTAVAPTASDERKVDDETEIAGDITIQMDANIPLPPSIGKGQGVSIRDLVDSIVIGAVNARATDVHFDPQDIGLRVRYRVDGLLHDVMRLGSDLVQGVLSRIKVMADLDIAERRHGQDGHATMEVDEKTVDMRVACVPTRTGEKAVLRIFDEENVITGLGQLGLILEQTEVVKSFLSRPYGMLLTSGPVGSGKTTTLYCCLNQVNILTHNIMTIEDPVEYNLPGTNQLQVEVRQRFGFADGLRAILRQDPDIIMVGEIRDQETAGISTRAAMTGVLVLSSIHANDCAGAISAMLNLGVPGFTFSSALGAVIAQRLVRKICPHCRTEYEPDFDIYKELRLSKGEDEITVFYRGTGCDECFHTGYLGRTAVFEIMEVSPEVKDLIFRETTKEVIHQVAQDVGMKSLREIGLEKVRDGITTPEEILRLAYV